MIAIADSGSTKTDWVILNQNHNEELRTSTIGLNPYYINSSQINEELNKNNELKSIANNITQIYFYGAGCSNHNSKQQISNGLKSIFSKANILVSHDLLAACYATYKGKPSIVCILGTGSNSCYFDGKSIYEETSSLGFILGDEGSGSHLGKKLLRAYFTKKLPLHLVEEFNKKYNLTIVELNENIYKKQFANTYLASFSKFVHKHKDDEFIKGLIYESIQQFFDYQVLPYKQAHTTEVNFIGSIAHYYKDIIREVTSEFKLNMGKVVHKPIDNLIDYHKKYIINQ